MHFPRKFEAERVVTECAESQRVPESISDGGHGGGRGSADGALPLGEAGGARAHQRRAQRLPAAAA